MKDWAELPVSAQVKRIRGALADVLPRWGLGNGELKFIFHGENTTFRAETPRGRFLVRVARHGYNTPAETESELRWAEALHVQTGLAPKPLRTRDSELVAGIDDPNVAVSHACVFRWVEGVVVGRHFSNDTAHAMGAMMARLHVHAETWCAPKEFNRRRWNQMAAFGQEFHEDHPARNRVPRKYRSFIEDIRTAAQQACRDAAERGQIELVHADLHRRNVLRTNSGLVAIDFDDCGEAPWLHDIAVCCAYWSERQHERFAALMAGYRSVREFPSSELTQLPLFVAARLVGVCLWVTGRAAENATFRPKLRQTQDTLMKMAAAARDRKYC